MSNAPESAEGGLPSKTSEGLAAKVESLIAPALEDMGYDIVRIILSGGRSQTLQIMVDRKDGKPIDVEDCAAVSRASSAILDVEDPISSAYVLEVSSPGIDRPLTRLGDFARFAGFEARVEMEQAVAGQRRFSGRLLGVEGLEILIETEEGPQRLPFAALKKAKLLLTDDLIAAAQREAEQFEADED
ncbi:ribosome maturation factor RimP [Limibacillus halophilus]